MKTGFMRRTMSAGLAVTALTAGLLASAGSVGAAGAAFSINRVGSYGGEPSLTSDGNGQLYEASLAGARTFRSTTAGTAWTPGATSAYSSTGDDCLGTDQANAVYLCNLTITGPGRAPLQADVYKSLDQGDHWTHGSAIIAGTNANCSTSCSPFGVDRDWVDAYIPTGGATTATSEVALMYHDFYGPSHIWVNLSQDGGTTFSAPEDVLANLNTSAPGASDALALADTACSSVPSAVKVAKGGPHPGRVFVAWIAADPSSFGTGCNLSQAQSFHTLFVAWADPTTPGGRLAATPTWTPQLAFDAGPLHDASTPFTGFTIDNQGNPYFGFANNLNWDPTCSEPAGNPQTPNCEYDMYVVWSPDGGPTWTGAGGTSGTIPGSAGVPFKVNTDTGTHWFPAIAAADPGQVSVAYLETSDIIPTDPSGKQHPGGCGPSPACTSTDQWNLWEGQSADLLDSQGKANSAPTWAVTKITASPMHQGDICNLGIACPPTANRNLADFISATIDPTTGCTHIAYADDKTTNEVDSANQTSGCFGLAPNIAETPLAVLLVPAGLAAALIGVTARRRLRRLSHQAIG